MASLNRIVTRIRKRLRVLKAALSESWHEHRCCVCGDVWVCQGRDCRPWPDDQCAACEAMSFERFTATVQGKAWR